MKLIEKWVDDNEGGRFRTTVTVVLTPADVKALLADGRVELLPRDDRFHSKLVVAVESQGR